MNTNWSDYERFLKPAHLKGQAVTLTIVKATEEETHPQKGKATLSPVLWFREVPFGLILSPTNRQTLTALYGDAIQDCIGKPIAVQAVSVKVAGSDKQPIRILRQRPNAPHVEPATGEIIEPPPVTYPTHEERVIPQTPTSNSNSPASELDASLGPRPSGAAANHWPTTEVEFLAWLKAKNINGKDIRAALGTDAKSWLHLNAGKTWSDVAQTIAATLGK